MDAQRLIPAPDEAAPFAAVAPATPTVTLFVCTTCRAADVPPADAAESLTPDGIALLDAVRALALPETVAATGVRCLGNCKRSLSAALVRRDGWTYVFGGLSAAGAADIVEGARLLAESTDGLMPWRGRPEILKRGMVARIPPLSLPEDIR
ncbi:DUF1636 family protein [Xanthobacter sp. KR7-65]|uniref:DUF1636 family protein n=1 Tax=Xanthobacter sp. KR7-65 TaxID=3156612 RepID=UPI0032B39383